MVNINNYILKNITINKQRAKFAENNLFGPEFDKVVIIEILKEEKIELYHALKNVVLIMVDKSSLGGILRLNAD